MIKVTVKEDNIDASNSCRASLLCARHKRVRRKYFRVTREAFPIANSATCLPKVMTFPGGEWEMGGVSRGELIESLYPTTDLLH